MKRTTLNQLAACVRGRVVGDDSVVIKDAKAVEVAGLGDITVVQDLHGLRHLKASAAILGPHFRIPPERQNIPILEVEDPQVAFAVIQKQLLQSLRLLVVGDVMYDVFEYFTSSNKKELKSEFPGKWAFVNAKKVEALGGAANVAANIACAGVKAGLVGVVGEDDAGRAVAQLCDEQGIGRRLVKSDERNTTWKSRLYIDGEFVLRRDEERDEPIAGETAEAVTEALAVVLAEADAIILSDYNKGMLKTGNGLARRIIDAALEREVPVVVDCKPTNIDEFRGATVVAPNDIEAEQLMPGFAGNRESGVRALRARLGVSYCVVTLGEDGLLCATEDGVIHVPGERVDVKNPVGAGDTVRAFLGIAIALGKPIEECLQIANAAAARVIQKEATATLNMEEVLEVFRRVETGGRSHEPAVAARAR